MLASLGLPGLRISMEGVKYDADKDDWSLLPLGPTRQVIKVLMYGLIKYARDNWQKVPDPERRYYNAAMRHLTSWHEGESLDPESGLPHLAHAACCLLFLRWFETRTETKPVADSRVTSVMASWLPKKTSDAL